MIKVLVRILSLVLLLSFTACNQKQIPATQESSQKNTEQADISNDEWWYIPAEEWEGIETREYSALYGDYVASQAHGSPDPQSEKTMPETDLTLISFRTLEEQYSIESDKAVFFEISYLPPEQETDRVIFYYYEMNIEREIDGTWVRMIDTHFYMRTSTRDPEYVSLESGQPFVGYFSLSNIISKSSPGKYRLVAYVNYQPVYAEFELTE